MTMWNWLRWGLVGLGIVIVGGIVAINFAGWQEAWRASREATRQLVYVVPAGTTAKLGAGQAVNVLPNTVELQIGVQDTLVIRNQDVFPIDVGGVRINTGQSYIQQFTVPGTFDLVCSVHTSDKIRVIVKPAR
jgi:plastocyanin